MKNILKIIIFSTIFMVLFYGVFQILWLNKNNIMYFYDEPRNSLDVIYIGSSNVYAHFNSTLAYKKYGFKTGLLSVSGQTFAVTKYLIKEAQKYQNPKLYVIDIGRVPEELKDFTEAYIRNNVDAMKFSKNRIDAINELLVYRGVDKKEYINYYFSFLMYHNRWKGIKESNFLGSEHILKGYYITEDSVKVVPQEKFNWSDDTNELKPENKKVLLDLIDYIKSNKLNVLFVIPVRTFSKDINEGINSAADIIRENGFKVINFNKVDELNIDYNTDFYNSSHLNVYGSTKYTLYFAKYLKENYNLENEKNDLEDKSWNEEYNRLKSRFQEFTKKNFENMLCEYEYLM